MGLCCCKIKDDEPDSRTRLLQSQNIQRLAPTSQNAATRNQIVTVQPRAPSPVRTNQRQRAELDRTYYRIMPPYHQIIAPQEHSSRNLIENETKKVEPRAAPPVRTNQRVEVDKTYPTITSPRENSIRNLIENKTKKVEPRIAPPVRTNQRVAIDKTYPTITPPKEHSSRKLIENETKKVEPRVGNLRWNKVDRTYPTITSPRDNSRCNLIEKERKKVQSRVAPPMTTNQRVEVDRTYPQVDSSRNLIENETKKVEPRAAPPVRTNQQVEVDRTYPKIITTTYCTITSPRENSRWNLIKNKGKKVQPKVAPPVRTNQQVEVDRTYPKIISPQDSSRNLIENKRKKRISYRKQIDLNVKMLRDLLRAVNLNKLELPIKQIYTYTFLDENSKHYQFAISRYENQKFNNEYSITCILHVWNPYILVPYRLKKLMYEDQQEERHLFHGTGAEHLQSILTNNFDWRKVQHGKYGWGISFANNPWYASHYSTKLCNGDNSDYIMILTKVLVGSTSYGDTTTKIPAIDCDTTRRLEDEQVLVKYDDCCFYPEFIVYFRRRRTDCTITSPTENSRRNLIENERKKAQPRVEPPVRTNQRIEVDRTYPKIISPQGGSSRNLIENERKKRIENRKQINLNIGMLRDLLQAVNINNPDLLIKQAYTYTVLDENSKHYQFAISRFENQKFNNEYAITRILYVWNPYILVQYRLKKLMFEDLQKERHLFHGTGGEHLESILTKNFDWRKVQNGKYGWGIIFANNPWHASHKSKRLSNGDNNNYIMILAKVLVGSTSYGNETTKVPAVGYDTTTRLGDEQLFVKYDDCCFYPEFVVYFRKRSRT